MKSRMSENENKTKCVAISIGENQTTIRDGTQYLATVHGNCEHQSIATLFASAPDLLAACEARQLPVLLANARLSNKSLKGYRFLPSSVKQLIQRTITKILAQTEEDKQRCIKMG